jgi:hypothetical protein
MCEALYAMNGRQSTITTGCPDVGDDVDHLMAAN